MEKIELRKFRENDLENIMRLFNNENILRNLRAKKMKFTRSDEKKWIKNTIQEYKKKSPKEYNLVITSNDEFVGGIGAHKIDLVHKNVEVGYWIGEHYQGRGYATAAVKLFLKDLDKRFGFIRISAYTLDYNSGSQRVLEKT